MVSSLGKIIQFIEEIIIMESDKGMENILMDKIQAFQKDFGSREH